MADEKSKLTKKHAISSLKKVVDPELELDIYTLGLIYEIKILEDNSISIDMTLTSPSCPYAPMLVNDIKNKLEKKGFKNPKIEFVFDPPWEPSEKVKMLLGLA